MIWPLSSGKGARSISRPHAPSTPALPARPRACPPNGGPPESTVRCSWERGPRRQAWRMGKTGDAAEAGGTATAIRARGLRKSYRDVVAVDRIDLEVRRGEIFALLGPNGAGKTTTT